MTRRHALWMGVGALVVAGCVVPLHDLAAGTTGWRQVGMAMATVGVACGMRLAWIVSSANRRVRSLPRGGLSRKLLAAGRRAGIKRLTVVDSDDVFALCVGVLHPTVLVSSGLATAVEDAALDAVLLHEAHHARRRDPLRRAAFTAIADVLQPFPVLRWWADRQVEDSELAADRAAIACVGVRPVAAAILAAGRSPGWAASAAFAGTAERRAAQLLGEGLPAPRMPIGTIAGTALGMAAVGFAALCTNLLAA